MKFKQVLLFIEIRELNIINCHEYGIFSIIIMFAATVALAIPFGRYIAKVYGGEKNIS